CAREDDYSFDYW
nr:immunoglobulin heavy chain junction region [Mus musculus]MBK4187401.1 immunoglobulin heavy chain junction region [Mus musculus]MBK4187402.1 immunoglobulin heavy chain junction region [Mus musculus]MBK4187403.1 immunoglobulin heavy chain junction region [Mus musculus]